jgi:polyhydroxybutyrate depolymerase
MRCYAWFALLACLVAGIVPGRAHAEEAVKLPSGRDYIAYLPADGGHGAPLLIAFHGFTETPENLVRFSGLAEPATDKGYVVIFPRGTGRSWNAGLCCGDAMTQDVDDVGFAGALIDDAARRYGIDRRRVFLTGMSNGAMLTYRIAAERPDLIAGIAPIAGTLVTRSGAIRGPVPVLDFHGTEDGLVSYDGGTGVRVNRLFRPVPETLRLWAKADGDGPSPTSMAVPGPADNGLSVQKLEFGGGTVPVVHYKVIGGGHTWPGRPAPSFLGASSTAIDADAIMLDFFGKLPSRANPTGTAGNG